MDFHAVRDTLTRKVRSALLEGAHAFVDGIQPDGKVVIDGSWTTYQQGCALLLAELYRMEDTPFHQSPELIDKLSRSFRFFFDMADEDGKTPLTTHFGTWGVETNLPGWEFSGFVWLYRFHRDILPPPTLSLLEDLLSRMARTLTRELPSERLHNIPAWNAAALWRAGAEFNQDAWKSAASHYLQRIVAAQDPSGFWFEHTGPTTLYNLVYVHALGLHQFDHGDAPVSSALDRAGAFHSRFVYPDGSLVTVIDGRVLYSPDKLTVIGIPGLLQSETGLSYCRTLAQSPKPFGPPSGNGANFVPQVYRFLSENPALEVPSSPGPVPLSGRASLHHSPPFTSVLSAILGTGDNRWGYDRLQHLEVHHHTAGVILGGGLSKGPELAFLSSGPHYLAGTASLENDGRSLRLQYPWGSATVSVASFDPLEFRIQAHSSGPLRMLLPLTRSWVEAASTPPPGKTLSRLSAAGVTLSIQPHAQLAFPFKPWYPYHQEGLAPGSFWRYALVWESDASLDVRLILDSKPT